MPAAASQNASSTTTSTTTTNSAAAAVPPELVSVPQLHVPPAHVSAADMPASSENVITVVRNVDEDDGDDDFEREEAEEVHSCITLSSRCSAASSSQGEPVADCDEEKDEEGEGALLLHSGDSSAASLHTPAPTAPAEPHDALMHIISSTATTSGSSGQPVGSSPSPVKPEAKHAAAEITPGAAPPPAYRVLDSEPSAAAVEPKRESAVPAPAPPSAAASSATMTADDSSRARAVARMEVVKSLMSAGEETLSEEQRYAYHLAVREHRSVFITGGAGTGKSHLLRVIIRGMPFSSTFVTATTGIAALNLNGTTLHSFVGCGVPDKRATRSKILGTVMKRARCVRNWRVCRALIIDEVSMLEASFFDLVDYIARHVRNRPDEPFGGIQLILSGDFLQLPPVMKERRGNSAPFCFETQTWLHINPKICLLSTPFRQRDLRFFEILNEMRFGDLQPDSIALLHSLDTTNRVHFVRRCAETKDEVKAEETAAVGVKRERDPPAAANAESGAMNTVFYDPPSRQGEKQTRLELVDGMGRLMNAPFDGYTILRPTRLEVEAQNERYFTQLDTEIFTYVGSHTGAGEFPANNLTEVVHLRKGCRVMVIKNFDAQTRLVNGSTGTVTGFVSYARGYRFQVPGISAADARSICVGRGRNGEQKHTMLPVVAFDSRNSAGQERVDEIVVEPQEWKEMEGDRIKSRSVQIPLVLAYAITIHKSQGMSLTQVDIDFAQVFEAGQSYVALSRCTDLQRVRLHGFNVHFVTANSTALAYYKALFLQHDRLAWQRQHTPQVVAEMEDAEARSCTPYGYVMANETAVVRQYGEEDSASQAPAFAYGFDGEEEEEGGAPGEEGEEVKEERRRRRAARVCGGGSGLPCKRLGGPHDLKDERGRWVSETQRLDTLRRRITPFLFMAESVKRLVLREMLPLPRVRGCRLVMDVDALFHLVTGPASALAFDVFFGEQDNMMRVALCVQRLVEEAAAYRSASQQSSSQTQPSQKRLSSAARAGEEEEEEALRPDAALLKASDVAAEALAVMERAKQLFILDVQRAEQTAALPEPSAEWLRFVDVLPLLRRPVADVVEWEASCREVNFILNRDPRETVQHRAIIEYALFLKVTFGQDVAVCTDSLLLGAYALAWGLRVVSVDGLV